MTEEIDDLSYVKLRAQPVVRSAGRHSEDFLPENITSLMHSKTGHA